MAHPLDHSMVPELMDAIHVALGLRLAAVVLLPPGAQGDEVRLLAVAHDLPPEAERSAYLERLMPAGSLPGAVVVLQTPQEFERDAASLSERLATGGQVLFDGEGLVARQLQDMKPRS